MNKLSPHKHADLPDAIKEGMKRGCHCPNCGQYVKMYIKPMGRPVARFLIRLYRAHQKFGDDRFFTTRELYPRDNKASTEGVIARFWELIEVAESTNSLGAPVGSYRLTAKGRRFVIAGGVVESHAYTYNNELLKLDGQKLVNIHDALGKKADFDELMKEV